MRAHLPLVLAAGLMSPAVWAAPDTFSNSSLDLFYDHAKFSPDGDAGSVSGSGWGARGWIGRSWPLVTLEYSSVNVDGDLGADGEIETVRAGLGVKLVDTMEMGIWVRAEMLKLDVDFGDTSALDDDGFALHGGGRVDAGDFGGYGELGYLKADDAKGPEVRLGVVYQPTNWGLFAEYRLSKLDVDGDGGDVEISDTRAGIRWRF